MEREILHVDVNNAFLSWTAVEKLKNGETLDIRTIPAIIGGDEAQRKGIVLAKSNIAKQFGIQTGEPIFFARKKCPNIQIKTNEFKVFSHQRKLDFATDSTKIIGKEAKKLLTEIYNNTPIRLIGVSVSGLVEKEERQISLFENIENEKQKKIDSVLDNIKEKYGYEAITRAGKMQIDKNIKFKEENSGKK